MGDVESNMIEIEGLEYVRDDWCDMPVITKDVFEVKDLIPFNFVMSKPDYGKIVHFFVDDHEFERVWNNPRRYVKMLQKFPGVFSPDFSLWMEYPLVVQMWNTYRNRLIGAFWQSQGIPVIPTIGWSDERSFEFSFLGVEKGSDVAISTRGATHTNGEMDGFMNGYEEMVKQIKPSKIIVYGRVTRLKDKLDAIAGNWVHFPTQFMYPPEDHNTGVPVDLDAKENQHLEISVADKAKEVGLKKAMDNEVMYTDKWLTLQAEYRALRVRLYGPARGEGKTIG